MSFPRYPAYKESNGRWPGPIPEHWQLSLLKHSLEMSSGGTPAKEVPAFWDGDVPWASSKDLKVPELSDTQDHITQWAIDSKAAQLVPANSLLVVVRGMILAHSFPVSRVARPMAINQDLKALRPTAGLDSRYLGWLLRGSAGESLARTAEAAHGTRVLRLDDWGTMPLPIPPQSEQIRISEFLDRETAKIDALIAEQERLIELLQEKRQSVISHAVTKGLNPDAPMKPSGIDWLGDVPAHWEVLPLKRYLTFLTSGSRGWAENYADEGSLFVRIANLTRDDISLDLTDVQRVRVPLGAEGERTKVESGDVLFSITAYLGSVAVVPEDLGVAYVSQHVALARLAKGALSPTWAAFVALSVVGRTWFDRQSYGGTKIQLSLDDIRELPLPVPPMSEQATIIEQIATARASLGSLMAEATRAIGLLSDRRAALISAVVTGQIDIRALAQVRPV